MDIKKIIAGAASGFVAAFVIDLNSWSRSTPKGQTNAPFDWALAVKRWIAGAITGATVAMGWDAAVVV